MLEQFSEAEVSGEAQGFKNTLLFASVPSILYKPLLFSFSNSQVVESRIFKMVVIHIGKFPYNVALARN